VANTIIPKPIIDVALTFREIVQQFVSENTRNDSRTISNFIILFDQLPPNSSFKGFFPLFSLAGQIATGKGLENPKFPSSVLEVSLHTLLLSVPQLVTFFVVIE
jgi:hypothetical protein